MTPLPKNRPYCSPEPGSASRRNTGRVTIRSLRALLRQARSNAVSPDAGVVALPMSAALIFVRPPDSGAMAGRRSKKGRHRISVNTRCRLPSPPFTANTRTSRSEKRARASGIWSCDSVTMWTTSGAWARSGANAASEPPCNPARRLLSSPSRPRCSMYPFEPDVTGATLRRHARLFKRGQRRASAGPVPRACGSPHSPVCAACHVRIGRPRRRSTPAWPSRTV